MDNDLFTEYDLETFLPIQYFFHQTEYHPEMIVVYTNIYITLPSTYAKGF